MFSDLRLKLSLRMSLGRTQIARSGRSFTRPGVFLHEGHGPALSEFWSMLGQPFLSALPVPWDVSLEQISNTCQDSGEKSSCNLDGGR